LGGGDVKLFAVLGALLGPFSGLEVQLLSYCVLLGFALCKLAFNGRLSAMLRNAAALLLGRIFPKLRRASDPELLTTMRLGPAIFAAALLLALHAQWPWLLS
jgi:prepilin peptidase CpaA